MKKLILFGGVLLMLSSCTPSKYFQVYKVEPINESIQKTDRLIFEDENCVISYNLWSEGGNIGFSFFNKTDQNIYINKDECFFILNGYANNYYQNRVFTSSKSNSYSSTKTATGLVLLTAINSYNNVQTNGVRSSKSSNLSSSSGSAVSYVEEIEICIPGNSTKTISEYSINNSYIIDCDLSKYPSKKGKKSKSYSPDESPYVFSNWITYTMNGERIQLENEFFISEISNLSSSEFFGYREDNECGKKTYSKTKYVKVYGADKYYIKYLYDY